MQIIILSRVEKMLSSSLRSGLQRVALGQYSVGSNFDSEVPEFHGEESSLRFVCIHKAGANPGDFHSSALLLSLPHT